MRWRSVASGYLGLIVLWTVLQTGPSRRLGGLVDDVSGAMRRMFDPTVAGIRNRGIGHATDINQTEPPGSPTLPPGAGPAPQCPPGFTARYDTVAHKWTCIGSEIPGGPQPPGGPVGQPS